MRRSRGIFDDVNVIFREGVGIRLNPAEFDELILQHGNEGEFRKHVACPCRRDGRSAPRIDCADCYGSGRLYPPELRVRTMAYDHSRTQRQQALHAGLIPDGSVQITFLTALEPAMGDQWYPDHEEHTIEEMFQREGGAATTPTVVGLWDSLDSQPYVPPTGPPRLRYERPCCFEAVAYRDPDTERVVLAQPYQYHVDEDRVWHWRSGGPRAGDYWTTRYRAPAAYQIHLEQPRYRSEAGRRLPYAVTALRLDRLSVDGGER